MSRWVLSKVVCCAFAFCLFVSLASPAQIYTPLVNFNGPQGNGPQAALVRGSDGNFYGTTYNGGLGNNCGDFPPGCGLIYRITPGGVFEPVYNFCETAPCTDGSQPAAPLVQGTDGNLYGTTVYGGAGAATGPCANLGCGSIFKITPSGVLTTLYSFCLQTNCPDGQFPYGGLVQGNDGNFYGTTSSGVPENAPCDIVGCGSVFRITPSGVLTTLHGFTNLDGAKPYATLVLGRDGNFYGTTVAGGERFVGGGTVFQITPDGVLTTLHAFCLQNNPCPDGDELFGSVVQGSDGDFYGTTFSGGSNFFCPDQVGGCGTVFKVTSSGTFTTLLSFTGDNGSAPHAGLALASDGNFYGTTTAGGSGTNCQYIGCGTVFRMTPDGTVSLLRSFNQLDGGDPLASVIEASDGNLYGTTMQGGTNNDGTVFRISTTTSLYTLTASTSGSGTVTSSDQFINCPGLCSHEYADGIPVTLTPNPAPGWSFASWSGACSGSGPCTVTMTQDQSVSATFTQNHYTLTASISGQGSIVSTDGFINCPGTCSHAYLSFTPVTLNASSAQGWNFAGWSGACAGVGSCSLTMLGNSGVSGYFMQPGSGLQFAPITPCRLIDTRADNGGGPITGGTSRSFNLTQLAQSQGCADLSSATAYSLNVTLVPQNRAPVSYLTIWPAGLAQPVTSTMNSLDGRVKANAAIVPAGNGGVSVYVSNTTNVILDIDGYFAAPASGTLKFYPLTPCRVADTRSADYPPGLGTPNLSGGVARDFPVLNSTCIPQGVTPAAYSLNFTAIPYPAGSPLGYLEVWPTGQQPQNPVSTLNNPTGTNVANAAIVPAGTDGKITTFANDDSDLAIDINGYFAATGAGGLSLYPAPPCRVFDTRAIGTGQPFTGTLAPPVNVTGSVCAPPSNAQGYVFNATVIPSPTLNYLTLWPDGEGQPTVSTLNAVDGWITSNMAIVPNVNGSIDAYARGMTQLILDISAYFAP